MRRGRGASAGTTWPSNLTVADARIVGSAPSFLGANPAVVPSGPTAGQRALTGEETLARALVDGLSTEQRAIAIVDPWRRPTS